MTPHNRVDPLHEVEFILNTYSGAALNLFKMRLGRALDAPHTPAGKTSIGSVEQAVRRIGRMLQNHPEAELKREAIRKLLGIA